jgi:hypothetical protein
MPARKSRTGNKIRERELWNPKYLLVVNSVFGRKVVTRMPKTQIAGRMVQAAMSLPLRKTWIGLLQRQTRKNCLE